VKCNLSAETAGLAYRVAETSNGAPRLHWEQEPVTVTVADAMGDDLSCENHSASKAAGNWLLEALSDGRVASRDLQKMAKENGIAWRTLNRVKESVCVTVYPEGFSPKTWYWELADGPKDANANEGRQQ
jgi:hypothetical protein